MPNAPNRQASVDSRRIALEREIAIRVPAFDSFVTEYSTNISTTGMFIVSEKPQPPGTTFTFEFSVADDWKLIRGRGQVVWARYRAEGANRPSGMGVRFIELDAQSRRLIRWIVEKHIREGGKPFELDELRSVIDEALEQVLDSGPGAAGQAPKAGAAAVPAGQPYRAASSASGERGRRLVPLLLTAIAVATVLGLLLWWTEKAPRSAAVDATPDETTAAIAAAEPPAADPGPTADTSGPREGDRATDRATGEKGAAPAAAFGEIGSTVAAWSKAWSDQDVDRYLSFYSPDFKPAGSVGLETWKTQRRDRLTSPEFIRVAITALQTESVGETRARALFFQSYRSDRLSDTVRKVLELAWQDDRWLIVEEKVVG